jgi:LacI family transcriptional regulator
MPPTDQQRLADLLSLSRTTVSRSLSNHPAIAPATRARVQALAAKLGYRKSPVRVVRRSRQAKPIAVGVLVGNPLVEADRRTLPLILDGLRRRARIDHVHLEVAPCDPGTGRRELFRLIRAGGWRGALLIYPFPEPTVETLERKLPTVSVLTEYRHVRIDVVDTDHGGVRGLVDRLVAHGHRRFGFLTWRYAVGGVWAGRRFAAFAEALQRHGLPPDPSWVLNVDESRPPLATPDALADRVADLVRRERVTAWVCAADHQAYPLLAGLRARGLEAPRDVSVTGFDGSPPPRGLPRLASLGVPNEHIGESALARLLSRLLHPGSPLRTTLVETAFIEGATLGKAPDTTENKPSA